MNCQRGRGDRVDNRARWAWVVSLLIVSAGIGCTGEIEPGLTTSVDQSFERADVERRLAATMTTDPAVALAGGAPYTLSGRGFRAGKKITIKAADPTSGSVYTTVAASDGTMSLSLTTNGPGLYRFSAYQQRDHHNVLMARATMSVTPAETCGDGLCSGAETCSSCPADCGACPTGCGNGTCDADETCDSCAADCGACPPACGDGTCNGTETCSSCPADCGACAPACGDGTCNGTETCSSCPADCGVCAPRCGDGTCNGTETCSSCPADCGACAPSCGDHVCNGTETCTSCPADCGACAPRCGDGTCNGTETCSSCAADCGACAPRCGDGTCNGTETCSSCPGDCGACPPACGDGTCNGTETCSSCPADCGVCPPRCGDGTCNGSETCTSCAADCGACTSCIPAATTLPNGQHNAGNDCMGCHKSGGSASSFAWTVAGTLYTGASSSSAIASATIRVTDSKGKVVDLVTASNGNFYTSTSLSFPLKVQASKCPDSAAMSSQPSSGACNSCHNSGFRIHLP
jgi:hypothetical protein